MAAYTSITLVNYNASAPSDDGTVADANKTKWSHVKEKIGDPLKTQVAAIDAALVALLPAPGPIGATTPGSGNFTTTTVAAGTALLPAITPVGDPNTGLWAPGADILAISTAGVERTRWTLAGHMKVSGGGSALQSATGSIHELTNTGAGNDVLWLTHRGGSTPEGMRITFSGATPNDTTNYWMYCDDSTNLKAVLYSNGSWQVRANSYGGISDMRLKVGVEAAKDQCADVLAMSKLLINYRDIDDPDGPKLLGLDSDQLLQQCPGLVYESPELKNVEIRPERTEVVTKMRQVEVSIDGKTVVVNEPYEEEVILPPDFEKQPTGRNIKAVRYSIVNLKMLGALGVVMEKLDALTAEFERYKATHP